MAKNYVNEGLTVDHLAAADIASGEVVPVGNSIGIAATDIATGATGTLLMAGVFTVPKVSAAVIGLGEGVNFDVSASAFDDNLSSLAAGDVSKCCTAMEAAGAGVTTIDIKINVGVGTVT